MNESTRPADAEARARHLVAEVSAERYAQRLWQLVNVASPTRREREAALLFADLLAAAGAEVEVDEHFPASPAVIGRISGTAPGPTIQLAGHVDHIDVAHPEPERGDDFISARGAADMKAGLAGILEVVSVAAARRGELAGELLVTMYGLHEAPLGRGEGLRHLIESGVTGDAAIVMEGPRDLALVCGKGQSIWNVHLRRSGDVSHELQRAPQDDELLAAALRIAERIRAANDQLAGAAHGFPLLGPESLFIGQIHYGDFYNRMPVTCHLQGTRRWHPDKDFAAVQHHLDELVADCALPPNISASTEWTFVGESYAVDSEAPIVRSLRGCYQLLEGAELPLGGVSYILDTSHLVPLGGVPTVAIDYDGRTAHGDREVVLLERALQSSRLAVLTTFDYLGGGAFAGD